MRLTILGSGTSTGVPVLGCNCQTCNSTEPMNHRTRCSALLQWNGKSVLIDTSTDFRQQALRENIQCIDAVLYTHTHADHVHGIDDLRTYSLVTGNPIPVFADREAIHRIEKLFSYIFTDDCVPGYRPRLQVQAISEPFDLFGQTVIPIPLTHGPGHSTGYRLGRLAYLTDCNHIPDRSWPLLKGVSTLVVDALRFRPHESHFSIAEAIHLAQRLGTRQTILTHLSHDIDCTRHAEKLPEGVSFAYDGQTLILPL
ncbi:MAG: GPMC system MBL fold metallohydrolase [Deltaproteobacteria bacterium]|nr:GPMC system MBL fold metallohydrolase [Deltaproteobacteria bacterium]MBW2504869.1 GPMC system MBL fold metallohydrolase [Deltaproteobacteria bacterium]MBW2518785.1 GPMC system MBL fold metallohydrolase [Deltaproteobacteria bacterium]